MQDTSIIKKKILSIIQQRGPSLPVHISQQIEQSMLFTSAFLSELVSEKELRMTNMRVGSSPVYYIPEQINQIETYAQYLKSKEKDAFNLLKEKETLKDTEQQPAIRVALRHIRDFAIPFKRNDEIYWRYFIIPEKDTINTIPEQPKLETLQKEPLKIFEERTQEQPKPIIKKQIKRKTPASQKKNEKFFEKIKNYLNSQEIEITSIIGFSKNDLTLKIKENQKEKLLIAFNKKKITEKDILTCHKKAQEINLPYKIFSLGEQTKKITNLIEAIKNLDKIETIF